MQLVTRLAVAALVLTAACSGSDATGSPTQPAAQVGAVQGTVKDTTGVAVAGAGLALSATGQATLTTTSAADGSFSFASVPVGDWTITVTPPTGFSAGPQATAAVTVRAGQTTTANLQLAKTGSPQSGNVGVSIAGFAFAPASVTIAVGSTITWKNNDNVTHTATVDTGSEFDSGNLASGASFSHTFNTKGVFTYHCAIHTNMKATITVQ